jgi:hypothetical protein
MKTRTTAIASTIPPPSHLTEAKVSGLDNMQFVCSQRKPWHPTTTAATAAATDAHAQSSAEPAGGGGEEAAESEGAEKGGEEGADNAEEGLQSAASTGLPPRHSRLGKRNGARRVRTECYPRLFLFTQARLIISSTSLTYPMVAAQRQRNGPS